MAPHHRGWLTGVNMAGYVDIVNIGGSMTPRPGPIAPLWRAGPPLTAVALLMTLAAVASAAGILVDPRVITGAPAWLKPFKFAVSTAVYSLTLAWVFGYLPDWPRLRRIVGWT